MALGTGERKDWLTARASLRGRRIPLDAACLSSASEPAFEPPRLKPWFAGPCERSAAARRRSVLVGPVFSGVKFTDGPRFFKPGSVAGVKPV